MSAAPITTNDSRLAEPTALTGYKSRGYYAEAWVRLRRNKLAMVCLVVLTVLCTTAAAAPFITGTVLDKDPNRGRLLDRLKEPSSEHYLGTDDFGRDTLARLIHAGRVSLTIGFVVAAVSLGIGVPLGLIAGYYGGWVDDLINAAVQLVANLPTLFILILMSVLFTPGVLGLALIFGILGWTTEARQVRGRTLSERRRDYVDAAIVCGAGPGRVLFRHILPNVSSVVFVLAGFDVGAAILGEAGLSALGFGVQIPTASWGNMLSKSLEQFDRAWWLVVSPGVAIVVTVFCIFVFADALRDALDPRLKH